MNSLCDYSTSAVSTRGSAPSFSSSTRLLFIMPFDFNDSSGRTYEEPVGGTRHSRTTILMGLSKKCLLGLSKAAGER